MSLTFIPRINVPLEQCNEWLSKIISKAMSFSKPLKIKHKNNEFKLYVFDLPRPLETNKVYFADRAYVVRIRSFDLKFCRINSALRVRIVELGLYHHIVPVPYIPITTYYFDSSRFLNKWTLLGK